MHIQESKHVIMTLQEQIKDLKTRLLMTEESKKGALTTLEVQEKVRELEQLRISNADLNRRYGDMAKVVHKKEIEIE